jgi:hypothetical protein
LYWPHFSPGFSLHRADSGVVFPLISKGFAVKREIDSLKFPKDILDLYKKLVIFLKVGILVLENEWIL